jgi:peptidyl-prolyl cis-trans isomerase A (cyclophilin A)
MAPMSNRVRSLQFAAALAISALAGCGGSESARNAPAKPVPDSYRAVFETSKGQFVVEVTKAWAPEGAERFYRLLERKFYDDARFFRVIPNFVVQFGINGDPKVEARWRELTIADDPVKQSNKRGTLTFAMSGPNSRTTQVFINLKDNTQLDKSGFAPFGTVVEGMDVVDRFFSAYRDGPPRGTGPDQTLIEARGNSYLETNFPRLDYIQTARIEGAK